LQEEETNILRETMATPPATRPDGACSLPPRVESSLRPLARELLTLLGFFALTALATWPWATRLRDAVADEGDPYMIAWTLWWNYHQTFSDPLNLFHANVFYPFEYTLAFSENEYGIALLFFPLFALGARPLTVQSVATFAGFAFCGYAAFRLARTLTGSSAAGWVAGVCFAFVPYRFHLLSHLHYLFAGWIPLLLEALILFARARTWRRAAWLGAAFTMNALTCITWFVLTLPPLALTLVFLVARHRLARERDFWVRGLVVVLVSTLVLLPFFLPYHYVSQLYGFAWSREDVLKNSPRASAWLVAERRNKFWEGFGARFAAVAPLFPGLLPLLLALASLLLGRTRQRVADGGAGEEEQGVPAARAESRRVWAARLDAFALCLGILTAAAALVSAVGFEGAAGRGAGIFNALTIDRLGALLAAAVITRLCLAYPRALRRRAGASNLIETVRGVRGDESLWVGALWAAVGFLMSLGMNSLFYRIVYENFFSSAASASRRAARCWPTSVSPCWPVRARRASPSGSHAGSESSARRPPARSSPARSCSSCRPRHSRSCAGPSSPMRSRCA
jgi:hypothetical protein